MRIHRSFLLLLVIPLLLDLLVVFSTRPYPADEMSYCERESVEALRGLRKTEERLEEEGGLCVCLLNDLRSDAIAAPVYHLSPLLSCISGIASFPAGWTTPLRI